MICAAVRPAGTCWFAAPSTDRDRPTGRVRQNKTSLLINIDKAPLTDCFETFYRLLDHQTIDPKTADYHRHVATALDRSAFVGERHPVLAAVARRAHLA